jgi:hypothetical protein
MTVLQACQQNNDLQPWFVRLNNVLVRYLTYATPRFKAIRTQIFINTLGTNNPGAALNPTQVTALRAFLTQEYNLFAQAGNPAANPDFVSLTQPICGPDYLNLDIPVFYHRIGTMEVVDSTGTQVPIPQSVLVDNPAGGTRQARVLGVGGIFNRTTFFANQPTTTIVDQGQVQILVGAGFAPRQNLLRGTITTALGDNATNPPSEIVGINE